MKHLQLCDMGASGRPTDGGRIFRHWNDKLLIQQNSFSDGETTQEACCPSLCYTSAHDAVRECGCFEGRRFECPFMKQLACLVEGVTRDSGEKRLTGAVCLEVFKTFDTLWVDDLLYKLTILIFPHTL